MSDFAESDRRGSGIALVGYRASGKTTIGRLLANRLGRPFVDSDAEVERRSGRTIASIFSQDGEAAFRVLEAEAIRDIVARYPGAVLSTGGGAILRPETRSALRQFGHVVYFWAPAPVLASRLRVGGGDRPALTSAGLVGEVEAVLAVREPLYREVSDMVVDTSTNTASGVVRLLSPLALERAGIGGRS